jgi:hypothetical protein
VLTDPQVEALAVLEHERWVRDLDNEDWTHGPEKDAARRVHPKLVPWDDLTEEDRDKDRAAVAAIPSILAQAGFEIVPVDDASPKWAERDGDRRSGSGRGVGR